MLSPRNGIRKVVKTILHAWCHPWFPGMYYNHVTAPYLKSTLELLWEKEPKVLNETCLCRFREKTNVNQYLFKYWQLASANFYPASLKEEHCFHLREKWTPKVCRAIRNKRYSIICINDIGVIEDVSKTAEKIREAFEDTLPDKCSFEKDR